MILGIDPGAKPGFAITDPSDLRERAFRMRLGAIVWCDTRPPLPGVFEALGQEITRYAVEYQWIGRREDGEPGARPADIVKLAFRAGYLLRACAGARPSAALEVHQWKGELFRNGGSVSKGVYLARLAELVLPEERDLIPKVKGKRGVGPYGFSPDALDAIGISWAASTVDGTPVTLEQIL